MAPAKPALDHRRGPRRPPPNLPQIRMAPAKPALDHRRGPRRPPPNLPQIRMAPAKPALETCVYSRDEEGSPVSAPLLSVRDLTVGYAGQVVLRGVSLEARAGRFTALVGPNGAGKSTLLRAIAGVLPVAGGEITLDGRRVDGAAPWELAARGIVLVPEGRRLWAPRSVR